MKTNLYYGLLFCGLIYLQQLNAQNQINELYDMIVVIDKDRVLSDAEKYLEYQPLTVTSVKAVRSAGGIHDYYSEGDYWWPDPHNPQGPYIRRDGLSNPDNFNEHRDAVRKLSIIVPVLTAAFKITGDSKYSDAALRHLEAWFIDEETKMNPDLKYAQAIKGRVTGRGIGIIDAIHFVEVVQAIIVLESEKMIAEDKLTSLKKWFRNFTDWLVNDQFGVDERNNGNNHATCWNMQVAEYSKFIGDEEKIRFCRDHFKTELLPKQMNKEGSFPRELERTKPYSYSLFNLDALATTAWILSSEEDNLWEFVSAEGKNIKAALDFMCPFIEDKSAWPYKEDILYYDQWPVRHPSLLFGYAAYDEKKYFELWKILNPSPDGDEVLRNFFIRQPLLWLN